MAELKTIPLANNHQPKCWMPVSMPPGYPLMNGPMTDKQLDDWNGWHIQLMDSAAREADRLKKVTANG